jgi:hypothetical protein
VNKMASQQNASRLRSTIVWMKRVRSLRYQTTTVTSSPSEKAPVVTQRLRLSENSVPTTLISTTVTSGRGHVAMGELSDRPVPDAVREEAAPRDLDRSLETASDLRFFGRADRI